MVTREQAWQQVNQLITNPNLIKHCLAVEAAMHAYAEHFNVPESEQEKWLIAGLVHDADYEKYPDKHPTKIVNWLAEQGADEQVINAVASHGFDLGVEATSLMAKTLRAVDELTGLIVAIALMKDRKLGNVTVNSVKKKWTKKDFAAGVNRQDIERGAQEINIPLDQHIGIVLNAMQDNAKALGL